jgi:hypothetical protein
MVKKPVSVARAKTAKVQHDIAAAEAKLHGSNQVLANADIGTVSTRASVKAAVAHNEEVEKKLHDAVDELAVVSALLKTAEAKNAVSGQGAVAGHRSGEGLDSVIAHLEGTVSPREPREEANEAQPTKKQSASGR